LDLARPQTAGEEELQLQLALAMSREEAEKEDEKRRSDDVRLALAISQSQEGGAIVGYSISFISLFHICWSFLTIPAIYRRDKPLPLTGQKPFFTNWLFLSLISLRSTRGRPSQQPQQPQQSHLLDLLDVSVNDAAAGWVDPWGTPAHPSEPPVPVMPPRPKVCQNTLLKYPSIHRQLFNSHDAIIFGKAVSFAFCPFSLLNSSIGEILVFSFPL
jgi:hypothetical protein